MKLLKILMSPADGVCDRLGIANEHERGMMRMLVNMCLCTVIAGFLTWAAFA